MLTTQILVKNNEETIKETLESLIGLKSKILIGNLGSTDKTLDICKKYNVEIIDIDKKEDYSLIRNELSKEGINFFINPGEVLVSGSEIINSIEKTTKIYVFNNNTISKEIRIWKEDEFINPIYETIINKNCNLNSKIIIKSKLKFNYYENEEHILKSWLQKNPFNLDVIYYYSFYYLSKNDFKNFIFYSQKYFAQSKIVNESYINLKYYCAIINLHQNKIKQSAEDIITCLVYKPNNSEFWSLLGDIYYKQNKLEKSKSFYENALIMSEQRNLEDNLPIELDKYKKHPKAMIENINNINKNLNYF